MFLFCKDIVMIQKNQINLMRIKQNLVMKKSKISSKDKFVFFYYYFIFRIDIEIPDEEIEEEAIRRSRLRRELLKQVVNKINKFKLFIVFVYRN